MITNKPVGNISGSPTVDGLGQVSVTPGVSTRALAPGEIPEAGWHVTLTYPIIYGGIDFGDSKFYPPPNNGAPGDFLTTDGNGNLSWVAAGAGTGSVGAGLANQIAYYPANGTSVAGFTTGGADQVLATTALGALEWRTLAGTGTVDAGLTGQLPVYLADGTTVTGSPNITLTQNVGGVNLNVISTAAAVPGVLALSSGIIANTVSISAGTASGSWRLTLPDDAGAAGQFLQTDGAGVATWADGGAGTVNAGLANQLPVYLADGSAVTGSPNITLTQNVGGVNLNVVSTAAAVPGVLSLSSGINANTVSISAGTASGSWRLTLPDDAGTANQVLSTDGLGVTSWVDGGSGTVAAGLANQMARYNADGTTVSGTNLVTFSADTLTVGADGVSAGNLSLRNGALGGITLAAGIGANWTLTFPGTPGTNGQVLRTDGLGGTEWVDSRVTGYLPGSVIFTNIDGELTENNAQFFWNNTDLRLGIGTNAPTKSLDVRGDAIINGVIAGRGAGNIVTNTAFGKLTLNSNTTGANNAAFGADALTNTTNGSGNTAIGSSALISNITGEDNVAVGYGALSLSSNSDRNVCIGWGAMANGDPGDNNTAVGASSLLSVVNGSNNIGLGASSGSSIVNGSNNVIIGGYAGQFTLNDTIVLADGGGTVRGTFTPAGQFILGSQGFYSGSLVLTTADAGGATTISASAAMVAPWTLTLPATGGAAGQFLQTNGAGVTTWVDGGAGTVNAALANQAAFYAADGTAVSGTDLVTFNANALTVGADGVAIGVLALRDGITGGVNVQPGNGETWNMTLPPGPGETGQVLTTDGLGVTSWADASVPTFTEGSVIFAGAGGALAQDNAQFFWNDTLNRLGIGTATPGAALDVNANILINGLSAGSSNTLDNSNTAFGREAMNSGSPGASSNTAIGIQALQSLFTSFENTAIGAQALQSCNSPANTAVGSFAANQTTTGSNNVAVGSSALISNATGSENVALGDSSLIQSTGNRNIAIGRNAGFNLQAGNGNVFLGGFAGVANSTDTIYLSDGTGSLRVTINSDGDLIVGRQGVDNGTLVLATNAVGGGSTQIRPSALAAADWTMTLPVDGGTAPGQVLTTDGAGVTSWVTPSVVDVGFEGALAFYPGNGAIVSANTYIVSPGNGILTLGDTIDTQGFLRLCTGAGVVVEISSNPATAGDYSFVLPVDAGETGQVLQTDGFGVTSWAALPASPVNAGLEGDLAFYAANGSTISANSFIASPSDGQLTLGNSLAVPGVLRLGTANGFGVNVNGNPASIADVLFVLPPTNGTAGQALTTDGTGVTSWTTVGGNFIPQVAPAVAGNVPTLTAGGDLTDSGIKFDDTLTTTTNVWSASQTQSVITSELLNTPTLPPVLVASTANIAALTGGATVDGVALATGNFILLKNQTTAGQNGVWRVNTGGAWVRQAVVAGAYADVAAQTTYAELGINGGIVNVTSGTANKNIQYQIAVENPAALFATNSTTVYVTATTKVPQAGITTRYVDTGIGNDTNNNGSQAFPYATIAQALVGASYPLTITVSGTTPLSAATTWASGSSNTVVQAVNTVETANQQTISGQQTFASASTRIHFRGFVMGGGGATAPFSFASGAACRNQFEDLSISTTAVDWLGLNANVSNWITLNNITFTTPGINAINLPAFTNPFTIYVQNQNAYAGILSFIGTGSANTTISISNCAESTVRIPATYVGSINWAGSAFEVPVGSVAFPGGVVTSQGQLDTILASTSTTYDGFYAISGFAPTSFAQGSIFGKQSNGVATQNYWVRNQIFAPTAISNLAGQSYLQTATGWAVVPAALVQPASQAALGASIVFDSIPSDVRSITIMLTNVQTSGSSSKMFQVGGVGGWTTTGYAGCALEIVGNTHAVFLSAFDYTSNNTGDIIHGAVTLSRVSATANTWVIAGTLCLSNTDSGYSFGGSVTLSEPLTKVRASTMNGTDTYNAGTIGVIYGY